MPKLIMTRVELIKSRNQDPWPTEGLYKVSTKEILEHRIWLCRKPPLRKRHYARRGSEPAIALLILCRPSTLRRDRKEFPNMEQAHMWQKPSPLTTRRFDWETSSFEKRLAHGHFRVFLTECGLTLSFQMIRRTKRSRRKVRHVFKLLPAFYAKTGTAAMFICTALRTSTIQSSAILPGGLRHGIVVPSKRLHRLIRATQVCETSFYFCARAHWPVEGVK